MRVSNAGSTIWPASFVVVLLARSFSKNNQFVGGVNDGHVQLRTRAAAISLLDWTNRGMRQ